MNDPNVIATYRRGKQVGYLTRTQREGAGYRWVGCLALLDSNGRWLYSGHWRSNATRKANAEICQLGYVRDKA
ncbi:MAG: hypothetical protein ACYSWO_28695 [Planctomycetota bacterium]|jgi:hypothetical protein